MSHHGHTQGQGHSHADAEGPTAILVEEHELILEALDARENRLDALEQGGVPDRAYFGTMVEFLRTFADACHHGKEERLLFEHMVTALGFPRQAAAHRYPTDRTVVVNKYIGDTEKNLAASPPRWVALVPLTMPISVSESGLKLQMRMTVSR
jgi:hypothetical protein